MHDINTFYDKIKGKVKTIYNFIRLQWKRSSKLNHKFITWLKQQTLKIICIIYRQYWDQLSLLSINAITCADKSSLAPLTGSGHPCTAGCCSQAQVFPPTHTYTHTQVQVKHTSWSGTYRSFRLTSSPGKHFIHFSLRVVSSTFSSFIGSIIFAF